MHLAVDCDGCHNPAQGEKYTEAPVDCYGCHQQAYEQTTNPSHTAFDFGTRCDDCHFTPGWIPANANHVKFGLLLEGIHATMRCIDCHTSYAFTNPSCIQCHQPDYQRGHVDQEYIVSEQCADCHTTGEWGFHDHDQLYFPIFSGAHKGRWTTCFAECHLDKQDFSQFTCGLNGICHTHDKDRMDRRHQGEVGGYQYESNHCYHCHSSGRGGD